MTKAVEPAFGPEDEDEGVANSAASLGPDGGPIAAAKPAQDPAPAASEDFSDDDAWLDEELSDEELAALGEEDFDDDSLLDEDLGLLDDPDADEEADYGRGDFSPSTEDLAGIFDEETPPAYAEPEKPAVPALAAPRREAKAHERAGEALEVVAESDPVLAEIGDDEEVDHRPVPRISIHAFCETPGTTAILERASVDRRLSKAHLTVHMGGIAKAIEHFSSAATPNLVILETNEGGPALFAQLGELSEVCDPSTKVVIIGRVNDIALYRELVRQGISEYIVRPRSPMQLIKTIAALYVDPAAAPIGKTIAFVGARGGVGSSTIAHNVAWCAAEEHKTDTIILDLDLPFGTASLDFEQDPTSGLIEALSSPERLDDVLLDRLLQKHTDRLSLFTAPNLLDRDYNIDDQAFETVVDVVRSAAPTIIVDMPHLWTSWSRRLLQTADEIVITAAPDLASFRNTKNLVDIISGARPNDSAPILVLNQFDPKVSSVQAEQYHEHVGLKPAAVFAWEPQLFHAAATNAASIFEVGAKSKTAQALRELATRALGRNDAAAAAAKFSLTGLFKKRK